MQFNHLKIFLFEIIEKLSEVVEAINNLKGDFTEKFALLKDLHNVLIYCL